MAWQRVRGHDAWVEAFRRAVRQNRLAHAYLFTGPAGVGKRLFATELAKALLCEGPDRGDLEACDRCPACALVDAGTHPDFFPAGRPADSQTLPIDVVRELGRNLALKPARGGRKVALLDDADDLHDPVTSHAAANAFLKTLEEPPPRSVLILIGTSAELQLPTIVSRCQLVRFRPLPEDLVAELLRERGVTDPALARRLSRLGNGSPGQALELADPELWEFRRTLLSGLSRQPFDALGLSRAWAELVEGAGKESAAQRRRAALVLRLVLDFFADALALAARGVPHRNEPEDLPALEAVVARLGPDGLLAVLERCLEADAQVDRRVQLVLVLEALMDALGQKLQK